MTYIVTLLYPAGPDATFDMTYYLEKHMPFVQSIWGKQGLSSWTVCKLDESSGYSTQCLLNWESAEHYAAAYPQTGTTKIMGDIPNYSNKSPIKIVGNVIGTS
jgi:uncharacterized protein (TIGR02118 family)